jgi:hypothetical protein
MIHWFFLSMMCSVLQRKRTWTSGQNDTIAAARHEGVERLSRPHIGAGSAPPTKRDEASFQVRLANGGAGSESAAIWDPIVLATLRFIMAMSGRRGSWLDGVQEEVPFRKGSCSQSRSGSRLLPQYDE